jgi:hypothetical protein
MQIVRLYSGKLLLFKMLLLMYLEYQYYNIVLCLDRDEVHHPVCE